MISFGFPFTLVLLIFSFNAFEAVLCVQIANATLLANQTIGFATHAPSTSTDNTRAHVTSAHGGTDRSNLITAKECWASWDVWSTSSVHCPLTTSTTFVSYGNELIKSTVFETFKLCDGHPRARATGGDGTSFTTFLVGSKNPTSTVQTVIIPPSGIPLSTITTRDTTASPDRFISCANSIPTPTCSIDGDSCSTLFNSWTAGNFSRIKPPCTIATPRNPCNNCNLFIPSVRLLYFPVSMTGNFCGNYSTVTPTATENDSVPATVQAMGTTFTSGFAYLSYAGITARGDNEFCGTTKPAGILALPSTDLFSYRGLAPAQAIAGNVHWPFNFADLAPNPVPWDAWISQAACAGHADQPQCQTITQAAYQPGLVYPPAFFSMEPEWSKCSAGVFGIQDPPTALPKAQEVATPTLPSAVSVTGSSASPQNTPTTSLPSPTTTHPTSNPKSTTNLPEPTSSPAHATTTLPDPTTSHEDSHPTSLPDSTASPLDQTTSLEDPTTSLGDPTTSLADSTTSPADSTTSLADSTTRLPSIVATSAVIVSTQSAASSADAISVLESALMNQADTVQVTISDQLYTAYSGGLLAAAQTTMVVPTNNAVTLNGEVISFGSEGVLVDSQMLDFQTQAPGASTGSEPTGQEVLLTYVHGSSETALTGYVDSSGQTLIPLASTTFTYGGQEVVEDGVTFSAMPSSIVDSTSRTGELSNASRTNSGSTLPIITSGKTATNTISSKAVSTVPFNTLSSTSATSGAKSLVAYSPAAVLTLLAIFFSQTRVL